MKRALRAIAVLATIASSVTGCGPDAADPSGARHLILVTVDTLRADRLGFYGYANASTPWLDAVAADSVVFESAYAHASMTLPSVASLLTGQLPAEHGFRSNRDPVTSSLPTLATVLSERGFRTGAFLGNYALRPSRKLDRGFDYYTSDFKSREQVRPTPENPADLLNQSALGWVDEQPDDARLFLWVHYQEPHGPYTPTSWDPTERHDPHPSVLPQSSTHSGRNAIPKYQWLGHGRLDEYEARYDGEIRDVDGHFGELVDALDSRGILERSVFVFTADHGEAFGEDDIYCGHGEGLDEVLLRVPLLLSAPGLVAETRTDRVRLIDVAPTALELLGFDAGSMPGQSLVEATGDRPLVAQIRKREAGWRIARSENWELSQTRGQPPVLRSLADGTPAGDTDEIRKRLLAELEEQAPWRNLPEAPLSPEEESGLRALGYVD